MFGIQIYTILQSFIQLFLYLMKLCRIVHAYPENFPFSQRIYHKTQLLVFNNKQMVELHKLLGYYSYGDKFGLGS